MNKIARALAGAAGRRRRGQSTYVEDVFSTYLYAGNGSTQNIKNGINLGGVPSDGVYVHLTGESLSNAAPSGISISNNNVSLYSSEKKFGSNSLNFDAGNPSYLYLSEASIDSSDSFCVETWAYFSGTTGTSNAMQMIAAQYKSSQSGRLLFGAQSGEVVVRVNGGTVYLSGAVSADTWHHIAWTYDGTTHRLFVDGDLKSTDTTMPSIYTGVNTQIGGTDESLLSGYDLTGFLDEFRITKGKARYTSNFSVPTSAFPIDVDNGAGFGGLTWIKARDITYSPQLFDTERGATKQLYSNITNAETTAATSLTSFNPDGFSLGALNGVNNPSQTFASWTFRKAEKFFDIVTYTGDGSVQSVTHNLGAVPKCMIVKKTSNTGDWYVYHVDLGAGINGRKTLKLDSTAAQSDSGGFSDHPTDTVFTVNYAANTSGETYVAYLFASDAGGFGDDDESIIKCGSYTTDSNGDATIDCGFEPQIVISKGATVSGDWFIFDNMRGMEATGANTAQKLAANSSNTETASTTRYININATGFNSRMASNGTFIYIAIRRPMKTPESGTEVFDANAYAGGTNPNNITSGFPVDLAFTLRRDTSNFSIVNTRLTDTYLFAYTTDAEIAGSTVEFDVMDGINLATTQTGWNKAASTYVNYLLKRATGFFDVVSYTGTGLAMTIPHNLGAVPELMIVRRRDSTTTTQGQWKVYTAPTGNQKFLTLENNNSLSSVQNTWQSTTPTSEEFYLGTGSNVVNNSGKFIAYLFATLDGVSKVGSYTGTGASQNIDCGFSTGARFILIKRTDSTGDWWVWDTERGITSGNDPFLQLNTTSAEVTATDYINPLSSGFILDPNNIGPAALNASGGNYIFLAIA